MFKGLRINTSVAARSKNKFKPKNKIESQIWFIHLINGDFVLK